jgi:hypothetical protein
MSYMLMLLEERKKHYACIIHKLERELGMRTKPLREAKMLALEYYGKHSELFKGITEDAMILYSVSEYIL